MISKTRLGTMGFSLFSDTPTCDGFFIPWSPWVTLISGTSTVGKDGVLCAAVVQKLVNTSYVLHFFRICSCWLLVVQGITWLDLCGDSPHEPLGWPSTSHGTTLTTSWGSLGDPSGIPGALAFHRFSALTAPTPEAQSSWCGGSRSVHPGRFLKGVAFW